MGALIVLALLGLAAAGLSVRLKCKIEEGLILIALLLITAGYCFAVVGLLPVAGVLLWIFAAGGAAYLVWLLAKKRLGEILPLTGGLMIFFCAGIFLWWMCRGVTLTDWDDFSHWGSALKTICHENILYTHPSLPQFFVSYPPGATLWEYILMKSALTGFREDIGFFAHALLSAIALLFPLKLFSEKQIISKTALYALLLAAVYFMYPRGIYTLGVDRILGVYTALILMAEFLPERTKTTDLIEVLTCFVLTLIKSTGFGLALLAFFAVAVHRACICITSREKGQLKYKNLFLPGWMLAMMLLAKISWNLHLRFFHIGERWQSESSVWQNLTELFTGTGPEYRRNLPEQFFNSILWDKNYGHVISFSFAGWFCIAALLGLAAILLSKKENRKLVAAGTIASIATAAVFVLSLLYSYLFLFSEGEATALASSSRYLTSCGLVMELYTIAALGTAAAQRKILWRAAVPAAIAAGFFLIANPVYLVSDIIQAPVHAAQTNHDAYLSKRAAQRIKSLGEKNPRLYLITGNDGGMVQQKIHYELLPGTIPDHHTILMTEGGEDQPWVEKITWQEWRKVLLDSYDYVYIYTPEDQFVREFLPVFMDESQVVVDRMFKVEHVEQDAILRTMPEITQDPQPAV